jgi:hypothetical protein
MVCIVAAYLATVEVLKRLVPGLLFG